jgi:peptidoglycan hydrolase-like protein with peptidoglycan-binding domain
MRRVLMAMSLLFLSGCVTATEYSNLESQTRNKDKVIIERSAELNNLRNENSALRAKLEQLELTVRSLQEENIRMPNGTEIQTALKNANFYDGAIDGQIGPNTKDAIRKFQQANGINADGVVGSKTWSVLIKYLEKK